MSIVNWSVVEQGRQPLQRFGLSLVTASAGSAPPRTAPSLRQSPPGAHVWFLVAGVAGERPGEHGSAARVGQDRSDGSHAPGDGVAGAVGQELDDLAREERRTSTN